MKEKNSFLIEQEKHANKLAAQVMQITFLFFTATYILNLVGIFIVDKMIMTIAYVAGSHYRDFFQDQYISAKCLYRSGKSRRAGEGFCGCGGRD